MNTFEIMRLIGDAPLQLLSGTETAILMRIALIADRSGKGADPGIQKLVDTTKFSRSSILRNLKSLIDKKILIDCSIRKVGSNDRSKYLINIELLKGKNISQPSVTVTPAASVTVTPAASVTVTPAMIQNRQSASVTVTPALVSQRHQALIQPIFKPIELKNNVEFGANSTSLASTKKSSQKSKKEKQSFVNEINEIFRHWQNVLNHCRARLDKKRYAKILSCLKSGYSVEDLKKVVDGVKKTPFNMGENDSGEIYDDICLIFRDSSHVERFIRNFDIPPTPQNKNGATASKSTFFENRKKSSEMMKELTEKLFPKNNLSNQQTKKESEIELVLPK